MARLARSSGAIGDNGLSSRNPRVRSLEDLVDAPRHRPGAAQARFARRAATRGVTCRFSMPCSGRPSSSAPAPCCLARPRRAATAVSAAASAASSKSPECAVLTSTWSRLAERQEALAEQAAIAAEVVELDADRVGLASSSSRRLERRDLPALPDRIACVQRRVVADDARAEPAEHVDHRARGRRHADQPDRRAAEFASDRHAVAAGTGTRRSSESSAPIMNSASAWAVAVTLRTTWTSARAQAARSMFSAPALTRPTACSTGA